jgi:hypothetical protein
VAAIARTLAGTHRRTGALSPQVDATNALAGGLSDLHGMQEARGSSPLSSTFPQVKVTLRSWKSLRRWLGLTATPYQRDKLDDLTALQVGAVRHAISRPAGGRKPAT